MSLTVALALFASSLLTQLFPSFVASLLPRPFGNKYGAFAGIGAGAVVLAAAVGFDVNLHTLMPNASATVASINMGLVALAVNGVTFVAVSLLTRSRNVAGEIHLRKA